jgi:uncharacterized protein (DUF58 family)
MNATLFDDEFLKKLEYLSVVSKRFNADKRDDRRLKKRGTGLEFADYRSYVPGDDFRHLDWKAYLRLNRLILKLFEEKQDLPIYFFVDTSGSMNYGHPLKLDYAERVAAALCYVALANLDRVNLVAFADGIRAELPPQRGKGRIFSILRFLGDLSAEGATNARASFAAFSARSRRRGLAVVISDFLDEDGFEGGLDVLRHCRHDIFVIHVASHEELAPSVAGHVQLVDAETGAGREVMLTPSAVAAYGAELARYCGAIEAYCHRYQLGYARTRTDVPFDDLVLRVFRQGRFLK